MSENNDQDIGEDTWSEPEIDPEIERLGNLTRIQLREVIKENEAEIKKAQEINVQLQLELALLERDKCENNMRCEEEYHLNFKKQQLRQQEIILAQLLQRSELLQKVTPKYQSFDVKTLPQVILCDKWPQNGQMPKIVVCHKPKQIQSLQPRKQAKEIQTCLTPQQLQLIEKEKRCIELECGQLQLQIAGVRGQAKIISNENNKLRAIIGNQSNSEISLKPKKYPCRKKKGDKAVVCPVYKKPSIPIFEINISSTSFPSTCESTDSENLRDELHDIENKVEILESKLAEAKHREETMKAQQEALRCVKEALK